MSFRISFLRYHQSDTQAVFFRTSKRYYQCRTIFHASSSSKLFNMHLIKSLATISAVLFGATSATKYKVGPLKSQSMTEANIFQRQS
jgi:hypothetical protein